MLGYYLMFNNNCSQALETYQSIFDAEVTELQRYGDMPPNPEFPIPDEQRKLILHARLKIGEMELMCADASEQSSPGNNMFITITTFDPSYLQKVWDVLKEDGEIFMDLKPSFFAAAHGSLRDKYGVNWMFTALK